MLPSSGSFFPDTAVSRPFTTHTRAPKGWLDQEQLVRESSRQAWLTTAGAEPEAASLPGAGAGAGGRGRGQVPGLSQPPTSSAEFTP